MANDSKPSPQDLEVVSIGDFVEGRVLEKTDLTVDKTNPDNIKAFKLSIDVSKQLITIFVAGPYTGTLYRRIEVEGCISITYIKVKPANSNPMVESPLELRLTRVSSLHPFTRVVIN